MKLITLYILILFTLSNSLFSQDTVTIYYDSDWKEITNIDKAAYYRKAFFDSQKVWIAQDYYISNKIQMTGSYKSKNSDVKNGYFVYYYENGNKKSEGLYTNDKANGVWIIWYENGNKEYEGGLVNDIANGTWTYYYESGSKKSEGKNIGGKSEGIWKYWHETGEKMSEGKFLGNVKSGVWNYWYTNGKLKSIENYSKGLILSIKYYYENGALYFKGNFVNDKMQGEWTYWNADGRVILKGNCNKGMRIGTWVRSFPDSNMKIIYNNGVPTGKPLGGITRNE